MKNIYYVIICLIGIVALFGCTEDPNLGPIITVETAEVGAFPRSVELKTSEFDLADIQNSKYEHDIDFRSINGGANVTNYIVMVTFEDNDQSNGNFDPVPTEFRNYTQSDFGDSENNTKSLTLNFSFTEVAAATGVAISDISPGDRFKFTTVLVLDDGRVFTEENAESTIFGPAFRAFFDWNVNATCPLPDDKFVGKYIITYLDGPNNVWTSGVREDTVTLAIIPGSTTIRAINDLVIFDAFGGFNLDANVQFVCDVAQWQSSRSSVGCGTATIAFNAGAPQLQDITNDATIVLEYKEEGGGCGYSVTDRILLTKI